MRFLSTACQTVSLSCLAARLVLTFALKAPLACKTDSKTALSAHDLIKQPALYSLGDWGLMHWTMINGCMNDLAEYSEVLIVRHNHIADSTCQTCKAQKVTLLSVLPAGNDAGRVPEVLLQTQLQLELRWRSWKCCSTDVKAAHLALHNIHASQQCICNRMLLHISMMVYQYCCCC